MTYLMTHEQITEENDRYHNTGGTSERNRSWGFFPAFRDEDSGRTELSRFKSGLPAPVHVIDGAPEEWVVERDTSGNVMALKASVIAGFLREGRFYTREEAANVSLH
jgi:hypothetical protein